MVLAPEPPAPRRAGGRLVTGAVLVAVGVVWLVARLGWLSLDPALFLPIAVGLLGLLAVAGSFDGPRPGLVVAGSILTALTVAAAAVPGRFVASGTAAGVGDRTVVVGSVGELDSPYDLGVGSLTLDLSSLRPDGRVEVDANVGVGELIVVVPREVRLDAVASAGLGEVDLLGDRAEGAGVSRRLESPVGGSRLVLDAGVALGSVEVRR